MGDQALPESPSVPMDLSEKSLVKGQWRGWRPRPELLPADSKRDVVWTVLPSTEHLSLWLSPLLESPGLTRVARSRVLTSCLIGQHILKIALIDALWLPLVPTPFLVPFFSSIFPTLCLSSGSVNWADVSNHSLLLLLSRQSSLLVLSMFSNWPSLLGHPS